MRNYFQVLIAADQALPNLLATVGIEFGKAGDREIYVVDESGIAISDAPGVIGMRRGFPTVFADQGSVDDVLLPRNMVEQIKEIILRKKRRAERVHRVE